MTTFAILLVLISALMHATWNYIAKGSPSGPAFVWLFSVGEVLIFCPLAVALLLMETPEFSFKQLFFIGVSGLIHSSYFYVLSMGYRLGDLSLVYPISRGVGPLLATIGAILLLGEDPSPLVVGAAVLIALGVLLLTGDPKRLRYSYARAAVLLGLAVAGIISLYTLWDGYAVSQLDVAPVIYAWGSSISRVIALSPIAWVMRRDVATYWRDYRGKAFAIGLLSPGAYMLILTALTFSPVSYVSPMRSVSILFGVLLGTQVLGERDGRRRLVAACAVMGGVVILGLA